MTDTQSNEKIIQLETAVAHLQYELEQMHSVLLAVQAEMRQARDHISKLERRMTLLSEPESERDLDAERPPHY